MTVNTVALPEASSAAPAARPLTAASPISAAGVNDIATIARQQLQSAVPATSLIPAYAANVAQPPKPVLRQPTNIPSSALAAQFIAQDPTITIDDLEIFTPPPAPQTETPAAQADDFLGALRIARGDLSAAKPTAAKTAPAQTQPESSAIAKQQAPAASEPALRTAFSQLMAGLPGVISQWVKRPTVATVRGIGAYQLAEARNASERKPASVLSEL